MSRRRRSSEATLASYLAALGGPIEQHNICTTWVTNLQRRGGRSKTTSTVASAHMRERRTHLQLL
eukprot:4684729-Pyramimonas_sp.AAC.1